MKIYKSIFLALNLCVVSYGLAEPQNIGVKGVFAPSKGYDNNDTVFLEIDGSLPNACYSQGESMAKLQADGKSILVTQMADRRQDGICIKSDADLPAQALLPIPFTAEVFVGKLSVGEYNIKYKNLLGKERIRGLSVEQAPSASIDSMNYATITNAFVQDYVDLSKDTFEVRLTGLLNSSCTKLSDELKVYWVDDVLVALPVVETVSDYCLPASRPFYKIVEVKVPTEGRYMLHARSVGGGAKNKLFSVISIK